MKIRTKGIISPEVIKEFREKHPELVKRVQERTKELAPKVIGHVDTPGWKSVIAEMIRQDELHGAQRHQDPRDWFPIFVEEVGEVGTAMQEKSNLREELVQVAAVALQWIEDIDRNGVNL
jgi:hypothetical protein